MYLVNFCLCECAARIVGRVHKLVPQTQGDDGLSQLPQKLFDAAGDGVNFHFGQPEGINNNTVSVREPDVRFGKPDVFMSDYRMSGFLTSEGHFISPDFELYLKTGRLCPDFRRLCCTKPVWNPFGTGFVRCTASGYRTFGLELNV